MRRSLLDLLRCPFCGTRLSIVETEALVVQGDLIESGVLGCECCAFPIVAGIPVMIADDRTRDAMHVMEAGDREGALFMLLGLDEPRGKAFRALIGRPETATYREALAILSLDAEADCFVYRFSDPTFVMIESILRAIGQQPWVVAGRALDMCGGTGHLTRVLNRLRPAGGSVVADLFFWKLWMARRFTVPGSDAVCCDANHPLPFGRGVFSFVVLSDAFPYIWHKRLAAEELIRLSAADSAIVLPHLHSALGDNFSAGDTLTPAAYRDLFAASGARLFSDVRLFDDAIERGTVDLSKDVQPADLGNEPSLTLVASRRDDLFERYDVALAGDVEGTLIVNPLYRIEPHGGSTTLTLTFPTPEYAEEFAECRRYLPDSLTLDVDLGGPLQPAQLGSRYEELLRRRIVIDAPPRYC
jgi:uncharacterized protein YbaR (Trm112 family)/SAM-dependent methyltransferase